MDNYIKIIVSLDSDKEYFEDIVLAYLIEKGFEGFENQNNTLVAFVKESDFNQKDIEFLENNYNLKTEKSIIKPINWNAEWEKNFKPVELEDKLHIRAPFHKYDSKFKTEIIIEPKMSFGTGHHETTYLMCKLASGLDFKSKNVLDMGTGTGILAIYASKLGADTVVGIDIDEWSYNNSIENAQRNNCENIKIIQGDVTNIPDSKYDIIFANINKNILSNDIPAYSKKIKNEGLLLLSGFYTFDLKDINNIAEKNNLKLIDKVEKNNWLACKYIKQT